LESTGLLVVVEDEDVRARSRGAVRAVYGSLFRANLRPERGGLYCDELFGAWPGLEEPDLRRERFGHIELARPVLHPWLGIPMTALAVLPPGYRAMRDLGEGRFEEPDLTVLYAVVLERNQMLKRLMELSAPESVVAEHHEKLSRSVHHLYDNDFSVFPVEKPGGQRYRSLASHLGTRDDEERAAILFALGFTWEE
jgi:DNA-directed RNA polymerase beta' subunit